MIANAIAPPPPHLHIQFPSSQQQLTTQTNFITIHYQLFPIPYPLPKKQLPTELAPEGVKRISTYVGETPAMFSYRQAADYVIANSASFGSHTPEQWELFTRHYVKQKQDQWVFNYDPAISVPFRLSLNQAVNLWPFYDAIKVPTHVLRGAQSDLFSEDIAKQMTQRGPKAGLSTFAKVGHAPSLLLPNQIQVVQQFIHSLSKGFQ